MANGSRPSPALAALSALTGRRWKLGPARNKVSVERDVAARMRDGAVLLADHYAPVTSGPRPAVLMRCPYGRALFYAMPALPYAERGYHVLLQGCRGNLGTAGDPHHQRADRAGQLPRVPQRPAAVGHHDAGAGGRQGR